MLCGVNEFQSQCSVLTRSMNRPHHAQPTVSDMPPGGVGTKPLRVRRTEPPFEYPRQQRRSGKKKKQKNVEESELALQQLQWEMQILEDRRRTLTHSVSTRESTIGVISEFFRLFRYGISAPNTPALVQADHAPLDTQLGFVQSLFHENVRCADGFGPSVFLNQLHRFSLVHDDVRLDLLRCVDVIATDDTTTVQFIKRNMLTVTDTTIQYVFPHLLRPENQPIAKKLVGHQFSFFANASFLFDEAGKVLEAEWTVDFVTGMLEVLTLVEVAVVLQQAQIARDGYLMDGPSDGSSLHDPPASTAREARPSATEIVAVLPKKNKALPATEKKREQWRRNQNRYRKQRLNTIGDLEVDVAKVRMDILHLEAQRRSLREAVSTRDSSVSVVVELFQRLRGALATAATPLLAPVEPQSEPQSQPELVTSHTYHKCASTSTNGHGFASFMNHMRRFALVQSGVHIELLRCEQVSATEAAAIVEVVQRVHFTLSDTAIRNIFPRLQLPQLRRVKDKLLGQQLNFLTSAFFVVDNKGAVHDVEWSVDYATGLQAALTLEETVAVLSRDPIEGALGEEEWATNCHQFNGFRIPSNPQHTNNQAGSVV